MACPLTTRALVALGALLLAACAEEPVVPRSPVGAAVVDPPPVAEAAVPLVELTIAGVGTSAPTSRVRMLPATTGGPNPYGPDLRTTPAPRKFVRRELLRTPSGETLDFAPDGAWRVEARRVAAYRRQLLAQGNFAALNAPVTSGSRAPAAAAVTGVEHVPAILFRFNNVGSGASNPAASYDQLLFGSSAPAGKPYSVRTFYEQLSNNLLSIQGQVVGWLTLPGNEIAYTGNPATDGCSGNPTPGGVQTNQCNGLFSNAAYSKMQGGLTSALGLVDDGSFDWSQFDGNADGYVDMVIFIQSELDGACGGSSPNNHFWSHRSTINYTTKTIWPGHSPQHIKVRDYTLQSGVGGDGACVGSDIMPIGTAAHETGHAFGLPDLYDTKGSTEGIGEWGLMGSGNYSSPSSPSRMEAWSLNELGWVTLKELTSDGTYSLGAAPTSDSAFVIRVQGTNTRKEYYFIENRQGVQADTAMMAFHCAQSAVSWPGLVFPLNCHGGLAIWHADSTQMNAGKALNQMNYGGIHGLSLVQADNYSDLETGYNRGDAGDLWPGYGLNASKTRYSADSRPRAFTNADSAKFIGFTIDQITQLVSEGAMSFHLSFGRPLTPLTAGGGPNGTIELHPLSTGAFQVGGYNYVSATYQVRNANTAGAGYSSARKNLTFLAVATPTTLDQSNMVRLWRFDGTPSNLTAEQVEPTGAAQNGGGVASADVLQVYREPELTSLAPISGISSYLPYGFVVRNPNHSADRILPASPGAGVYDGLVTFAYRLPLQSDPNDNPYSITAKFLPVDDDQTWVTQSLQETDGASITAIGNRVNALNAAMRSLAAATVGSKAADTLCVRVAGPVGAATHKIGIC